MIGGPEAEIVLGAAVRAFGHMDRDRNLELLVLGRKNGSSNNFLKFRYHLPHSLVGDRATFIIPLTNNPRPPFPPRFLSSVFFFLFFDVLFFSSGGGVTGEASGDEGKRNGNGRMEAQGVFGVVGLDSIII